MFPDTSESNQPIKRPSTIPIVVDFNTFFTFGLVPPKQRDTDSNR